MNERRRQGERHKNVNVNSFSSKSIMMAFESDAFSGNISSLYKE